MRSAFLFLLGVLALTPPVHAEEGAPDPLTAQMRAQIVAGLADQLTQHYVYPDDAPDIVAGVQKALADGDYDQLTEPNDFARQLSTDLVRITQDQHFSVAYLPETDSETLFENDDEAIARRANFGFERLEILPGNIGYIRFDYFPDPEVAYPLLTSAIGFVENTDALIFDLRYNNGGYLETAQFLASHLFSSEKDQALFRYFYNDDGQTIRRSQWVMAAIPGKRRPDVPVYVLTSSTSFSAAEWMAFSLQELERATIVGQQTTGAAHPVDRFRIDDRFVVQLPIGKIFGPVSGKDFEGSGVAPDRLVESHAALETAYALALNAIAADSEAKDVDWLLTLARSPEPAEVARDIAAIQGRYDGRSFTLEEGTLMYRWRERFSLALIPLGDGLFKVEGTEDYRFRLSYEDGQVNGILREFRDGQSVFYAKVP